VSEKKSLLADQQDKCSGTYHANGADEHIGQNDSGAVLDGHGGRRRSTSNASIRSVERIASLVHADRIGATFSPAFCGSSSSIFCGHGGPSSAPSCLPQRHLSGAYEEGGIAGMLTIIKASLLASALMLLESCTGYLTSYQTPCVEGHVCECVRYTTVNRSWLDCRDYGRVKSRAY